MFVFIPVSTQVHELSGRVMVQIDQYDSEFAALETRNGPSIVVVDPAVSSPVKKL